MTIKRMWHIIRISLMKNGFQRAKYLKKKNIFAEIGEHCFWQPRNIPPEAKLIKLHDNVVVASEVLFVNHDVMHYVFNNIVQVNKTDADNDKDTTNHTKTTEHFQLNLGAIEIGNNVFIGSRSTILPGAKIADNVIFGADSLITGRYYTGGSIYAGNPAEKIGDFDVLMEKRKLKGSNPRSKTERFDETWDEFYEEYRDKE